MKIENVNEKQLKNMKIKKKRNKKNVKIEK